MPNFERLVLAFSLAACGPVDTTEAVLPDAPIIEECTPESDAALCTRAGATCGPVTANDNCGDPRTVDCGTCAPVCESFSFPSNTLIAAVNAAGAQDAVTGVSFDGRTLLSQRRNVCSGPFTLLITDGLGVNPETINITGVAGLAALATETEGVLELSGDGLTIVGVGRAGGRHHPPKRAARGAHAV
jgi:hypothetical protein